MKDKVFLKILNIYFPPVFWAGLIFYLSSIPNLRASKDLFWDEILRSAAHAFMYLILFLLVFRGLNFKRQEKNVLIPFLLVVLYIFSDEIHQSFVPTRTFQVQDLLIDFIGLVVGVCLWKLLPRMPKKLKSLAQKFQIA